MSQDGDELVPGATVKIDGTFLGLGTISLHYEEMGTDGETVICLHGTGPGASAWENFRLNARRLAEEFHVVLLDFPKFGRSSKMAVPGKRLDSLSGVVLRFMDGRDIERAHFVGNSMGGQVAMKLAIDHPGRAGRLVLVAPGVMSQSLFGATPSEAVRLIGNYYQDDGPSYQKMRQLMEALVYSSSTWSEADIQRRFEASVEADVLAANSGPHWERQSLESELPLLRAPTLLVWGQDDRASALDHGFEIIRRIQNGRLYIIPRCGHSAQLEHAEEFNRVALGFLGGSLA